MLKFIDDCDYLSSFIFREEIATWFLRMIHKTTLHATWEVHNEIWNSILVVNHCYRWICLTRISILLNISSSWAASFNNYTSQYENTVLIQKIFNKAICSNSTTNPPFHRNIIPVYIHQEKKNLHPYILHNHVAHEPADELPHASAIAQIIIILTRSFVRDN